MADDLIDVLVPVPLLEKFTYKLPKGLSKTKIKPGIRVRVPLERER